MISFFEFNQQVSELKKAEQYSEVLKFFKENKQHYPKEQIASGQWLVSNIITSLRKTNNSKYIDALLSEFNILINEQTDEMVLNSYGWSLYNNIKNNIYNKHQLIQIIKYPIHLLSLTKSKFSYSIISNILRLGIKLAKDNQNQDFEFTNSFCNLFDKNILTLECHSFEVRGKNTEQASDKEKWYSEKSKSLFELNKFQECFELSYEALDSIDNFHNNNDLWFARRIALSKKELGNINEAISDLEKIYNKKRDWFIQKEIAELYFENNDIENAFNNAIQAINDKGKLEFKIGLLFLLGKILKLKGKLKLSYWHFLLIKKIREDNDWKVTDELIVALNSIDLHMDSDIEKRKLIEGLEKFWKSYIPKKDFLQGKIKTILNNNERGKNGFIISYNKDYYFTIPIHSNFIDNIKEDVKVQFEVIELKDGKEKAKIIRIV